MTEPPQWASDDPLAVNMKWDADVGQIIVTCPSESGLGYISPGEIDRLIRWLLEIRANRSQQHPESAQTS